MTTPAHYYYYIGNLTNTLFQTMHLQGVTFACTRHTVVKFWNQNVMHTMAHRATCTGGLIKQKI